MADNIVDYIVIDIIDNILNRVIMAVKGFAVKIPRLAPPSIIRPVIRTSDDSKKFWCYNQTVLWGDSMDANVTDLRIVKTRTNIKN